MTIGQQVNALQPDAELHKWRRAGNNFIGTVMFATEHHLQALEGKPYHINMHNYQYELKRDDHIILVTTAWKFKLPLNQEIKYTE